MSVCLYVCAMHVSTTSMHACMHVCMYDLPAGREGGRRLAVGPIRIPSVASRRKHRGSRSDLQHTCRCICICARTHTSAGGAFMDAYARGRVHMHVVCEPLDACVTVSIPRHMHACVCMHVRLYLYRGMSRAARGRVASAAVESPAWRYPVQRRGWWRVTIRPR